MNMTTTTSAAPSNTIGGNGGTSANLGKSITRLLQHSILQLCNEHVGYSHKLQILGVLCMTVDDEQQELVVKVNNTLKRVSPQGPQGGNTADKEATTPATALTHNSNNNNFTSQQESQALALTAALCNGSASSAAFPVPNPLLASGAGYGKESVNEGEGTATTTTTPAVSPAPSPSGSAKKHGRKRSKPMRVDHVYDEGGMMDESDDGDILTVIPTDPDNPQPTPQPVYMDDTSDEEAMDDDRTTPSPRSSTATPKSKSSTASPNVRALLQQSIARKGSEVAASSSGGSSQLRSALLNSASPSPSAPAQSLTMPTICIAPTGDSDRQTPLTNGNATPRYDGEEDDDDSPGRLHIAEDPSKDTTQLEFDDSGVNVKDEPKDDYDWSRAGQISDPQELSAVNALTNGTAFPAFLSYTLGAAGNLPMHSGLSLAMNTANLQMSGGSVSTSQPGVSAASSSEGLSIRYTPTGPITVGANGKSVSQSQQQPQQKVKDIILYDDQSPLSTQKGARLETDFMVDKMGVEGRKRRRRGPDETLTLEEIAEYMGVTSGADPSLGHGAFQCKFCPVAMNELVAYLQHTLTVHNAYICHQCGKSFTTKSSLLRHRPIHTGMRRFACSICKKTFYRKDKCKAHIKRHLGEAGGTEIAE